MKRIFAVLAASALLLTGCGSTDSGLSKTDQKITYLPSDATMKSNMDALGYQTSVIGDFEKTGYTIFSGSNGKDIEEFEGVMVMRAQNSEELENQKQQNAGGSTNHTMIFVLVKDPSYGNVLITGTEKGIKDAGIKYS